MKMNKIIRKALALTLILTFVMSFFDGKGIEIKVAKAATTYALFSGNNQVSSMGLVLDNSEKSIRISAVGTGDSSLGIKITNWTFESGENGRFVYGKLNQSGVIDGDKINYELVLTPVHPGIENVTLWYEIDGNPYSLSCQIKVVADIDTSNSAYFPQLSATKNETLVMDVDGVDKDASITDGKYPKQYEVKSANSNVKFRGESQFADSTNNTYKVYHKYLTWSSSRTSVATVDKEGVITAVGPGLATITVTGNDSSVTDSIEVLVLPKYYTDENFSKKYDTNSSNPELFDLRVDTDKIIYSRAASAKNYLDFDIFELSNLTKKTDMVKLEASENDGQVKIKGSSRAGRYVLKTYLKNKSLSGRASWDYEFLLANYGYPNNLYFDIPLRLNKTDKIHMNVNDTFNLYDNSNVQNIQDFIVTFDQNDYGNILKYDESTGNFTALSEGSVPVTITLASSVPSNRYPASSPTSFNLTIEIANSINLNVTETNIPIGANVLKLWVTSDVSGTIKWTSSNEKFVKVDQSGNVSGIAQGSATVTASITVDGVVKKATCLVNVYSSVSAITITPSEVSVFVDDSATIKAVYTPSSVSNVNIKWISLDEKIAKVEQESNKVAVVTGVKTGETLIMAVSTNNIVLGTCKVTVKEIISEITLSDTSVEVPLSQGSYTITATVKPTTASANDIVWSSSNQKVATVVGGKLKLLTAGETIISASAPGTNAETKYCKVKVTESVTGLKLSSTEKIVYMGETTTIGYTVLPTTAGNKKVTWSSTKPSIATVNASTGLITPVSVGETVIIAKTVEGNFMGYCTVYVKEQAKGISIGLRDVAVKVGEEYQIPYTLNPSTSTEVSITWTSTNTAIATVTDKGVVKGLAQGSTIIMAKLANGEIAYCNVVVEEEVTGLQLNYEKKTIYKGKTFSLKATVTPNGATNPAVTYSSSNESVVTVSSKGKVTGKKAGTAIITVTTKENGYKAYCVVTVKQNVTKIKLNYSSYKLGYKKSIQLKATVTTTASNKKLKWTSSNPSVAKVSSTGKVTAKKYGTTTITATATDGSGVKATCKIRVVRLASKVKLNRYSMTVIAGRKATLKATVTPKNATYKTVTWSSSNKTIATVDSRGTVYALQPGVVYITAKAKDSSKKKAVCRVEVKEAVSASNITIITDDVVLAVNQSKIMPKSITPPTSTDSVTWESDNEYVATVNKSTGKVTGKHPGTCTITAYTTSGKMDTATVTVLGISRTALTLEQYSQHQLYLESVSTGVTWESTNVRVATVDNKGNVVARKPGKATIVATYRGTKFYCRVTVSKIN